MLPILLLPGCSIEQNNITSNVYHNVSAHFNGYFYAHEKALEVEKIILKSLDDDPNQILRLFPKLDTTLSKKYGKDTEEIIKMASISIQRHPNSRWVDDDYVMVGLARLYACDFQNAILTFKFVNTKSPDINLRHTALLHLLRTFTEMKDYDRAEEVFRFLEKEKLNKHNQKKFYLEKAYFYQLHNDYNNMVKNLSKSDSLLTKKDRKGRIYFILGQVYQKLGFNSEAYDFYSKCLRTNPDYEIDFYARLNMAAVAELNNKRDVKTVRQQFDKMLKDTKNQEFKDKIYFELGEFERKQNNLLPAIKEYKLAAHAGKNKRIQGTSFLRVGHLYFDSLKKYSLAKLYYDSAIGSLPKDYENYDAIKKRQEILGEFAKYTEAIQLNDSLLYLSTFDSLSLRRHLDSAFSSKDKKLASGKKKKKKSTSSDSGGNQNQSSTAFGPNETDGTGDWYFANPDQVGTGQLEFQRIWGSIALEDNWRRSGKSSNLGDVTAVPVSSGDNKVTAKVKEEVQPKEDPAIKLIAQIPYTEEAKNKALGKIEEGYFKLGDLYYLNLNEKGNAAQSYEKLVMRFPKSKLLPEVLYKLYLISKEIKETDAARYAQRLKDEFPNSTFAKILLNPDYLKETSVAAEKQKIIYKEAYTFYQNNNLRAAQDKITTALQVGETGFSPQILLLKILILGRTEDIAKYQYELGEFIKKYHDEPIRPYAEQLLASSKLLLEKLEKAKGITFGTSLKGPHLFVVIYDEKNRITNQVDNALDNFGSTLWKNLKLTSANLSFGETQTLTMISEFPDRQTALSYYDKFLAQMTTSKPFSNYKFYNFVISKDNFQIFYRTKSLDEYLTFFDRYYQKQNP